MTPPLKWSILLILFCWATPSFSQQLSTDNLVYQWKNSGLDQLEGVYAVYNTDSEDLNKHEFYGIIRNYTSHRLFICKDEDKKNCYVVGTLAKLTSNSFLANIEINNNIFYSQKLSFDDQFSKFVLGSFTNLEFIKIYPENEDVSKTKEEDNSLKKNIEVELSGTDVFEIPVTLNGVLRLFFIIDTGASETQISPDVALTLYRSHTIDDDDWLPGKEYTFADGSSAFSSRFMLHSVKIGGVKIKNVAVSISNSLDAPILLGQNVLKQLGNFQIDYDQKKLIIKK